MLVPRYEVTNIGSISVHADKPDKPLNWADTVYMTVN